MIEIGGFIFTAETLITVAGIATFTAMFVSNFAKPFLETRGIAKDDSRYPLYVNTSALAVAWVLSIVGLGIAQLSIGDASTLLTALARGFAAAFFATAGYEVYSNIRLFIAGRSE